MVRRAPGWALVLTIAACAPRERLDAPDPSPEARAVAYLAREVRAWPRKNKCFSCHNNGDAARALFAADHAGMNFRSDALDATTRWLARPGEWDSNGPEGEFSDRKLADLQFAAALTQGLRTGALNQPEALGSAAGKIRALQEEDGSLDITSGGLAGSPVTYGKTLATVMGREVLVRATGGENDRAAARAKSWLERRRPKGVFDAAALLLGLPGDPAIRSHSLNVIRKGQTREGGWGPYIMSPPEPFDTAVVLLALAGLENRPPLGEMMRRGRLYLVRSQLKEGSWLETTRPSGETSYAHRISTTGWATLALLATRGLSER